MAAEDESTALCVRRTGRIAPRACGRKAVETINEKPYCRRCASFERRVKANAEQKRAVEEKAQQHRAELTERMNKAALRLNVERVRLTEFGAGFLTGEVSIPLEDFEEMAKYHGL